MRSALLLLLLTFLAQSLAARTNVPVSFSVRQDSGLTGDSCDSPDNCKGGRKCVPRNTINVETCEDSSDCECKFDDPKTCQISEECEDGELCASSIKNSDGSTCRSKASVENDDSFTPVDEPGALQASPSASDGVCIDLKALAHLPTHDLVFQQHPLARVLCDLNGSCATPGHIITFNYKPMMMSSYCRIVACESKLMKVNSPRYSRGIRVPSRTNGLQYTALAARYQTVAEETVLGAVVKLGI